MECKCGGSKMKIKGLFTVLCCVFFVMLSAIGAFALPGDGNGGNVHDNEATTAASAATDATHNNNQTDPSEQNTNATTAATQPGSAVQETTLASDYYENQTEVTTRPSEAVTQPQTKNNWFELQDDVEKETEIESVTEASYEKPNTTKYVGFGIFMWAVIIVGVLVVLGILTNTHLRKIS